MNGWTRWLVSGPVVAFLMILGTAQGGTLQDAHDRAAPQPSPSSVLTDTHDRAGPATALLPDGRALRLRIDQLDAHSRAVAGAPSSLSEYQDAAERMTAGSGTPSGTTAATSVGEEFSWQDAGIGAGAALFGVGLIAVVLLLARRERRLAVP